jgi:hypothetical protein
LKKKDQNWYKKKIKSNYKGWNWKKKFNQEKYKKKQKNNQKNENQMW